MNNKLEITYFNDESYSQVELNNLEELELKENFNCWINIQGKNIQEYVEVLKQRFEMHELLIDDIVEETKRTKIEKFDNFDFIAIHPVETRGSLEKAIVYEDVYIVFNKEMIITFSNVTYPIFDGIIDKLFVNKVNSYNTVNKLNFAILEKVVDNYYVNFEKIEKEVDKIDSHLIENNNYDIIDELYLLRRNMIYMDKYITPFKGILKYVYETNSGKKAKEAKYYYRDLEEDVDTIIENLETYKELTNNIIDIVNNRVGDKTNQITTILTIWSTIFLPITFLTGVFGMNFKYMDALEWEFAFPLFWIISIAIVIIMIIFFRKKKWF